MDTIILLMSVAALGYFAGEFLAARSSSNPPDLGRLERKLWFGYWRWRITPWKGERDGK
jgi:hypothetical protein